MNKFYGLLVLSALCLAIETAAARSVWDDLNQTAPRATFDEIRDSAPRTVFDDIGESAPIQAPDANPLDLTGE